MRKNPTDADRRSLLGGGRRRKMFYDKSRAIARCYQPSAPGTNLNTKRFAFAHRPSPPPGATADPAHNLNIRRRRRNRLGMPREAMTGRADAPSSNLTASPAAISLLISDRNPSRQFLRSRLIRSEIQRSRRRRSVITMKSIVPSDFS